MPVNSRDKGKRGELEWAGYLREQFGCMNAHRGQQFRGGADSPDCLDGIPSTHVEVKRTEHLRLHEAVAQAVKDAGDGAVPYVAHRSNRRPWLVTVRASDLLDLARLVVEQYREVRP